MCLKVTYPDHESIFSFTHTETVTVTSEPIGKPSANPERYSCPLKKDIGEINFPNICAGHDFNKFSFHRSFEVHGYWLASSGNTFPVGLFKSHSPWTYSHIRRILVCSLYHASRKFVTAKGSIQKRLLI